MYITHNAREAKSDQAIVLTLITLLVAGCVWLVTRLLSR